MKKHFILFFLFIAILSCNKKSEAEKAVDEIPMDVKVERFEKTFYETRPEDFPKLRQQYPQFFSGDDRIWTERLQNPMWRELYTEVEKKYSGFEPERQQIEELMRHVKYYFPETKTPKVITVIGEMDYNNKVIYTGNLLLISLELYLGADHKFYEFPKYLTQNFTERQMMPDIATSFALSKIPQGTDPTLLPGMIYYGKQLYMKDLLLPEYNDADKIGYKPEQIAWCEEYEGYIWRYFIENKLLYSSDSKLPGRFINPAPFSKFYLEIDNDSPGRIGQWIGWQIVRSFMDNNKVSPQQMLKMDAKEIFEKSHYKPKKADE